MYYDFLVVKGLKTDFTYCKKYRERCVVKSLHYCTRGCWLDSHCQ